jgi:hypothetical protein
MRIILLLLLTSCAIVPRYTLDEQGYCQRGDADYVCRGSDRPFNNIDYIKRESRRNRKPE